MLFCNVKSIRDCCSKSNSPGIFRELLLLVMVCRGLLFREQRSPQSRTVVAQKRCSSFKEQVKRLNHAQIGLYGLRVRDAKDGWAIPGRVEVG